MTSHRAIRDHSSAAFYSSGQHLEHGFLDVTKTMPQLLVTPVIAPAVVELTLQQAELGFPWNQTETMLQLLFNSHDNGRSMVVNSTSRDHIPAVSLLSCQKAELLFKPHYSRRSTDPYRTNTDRAQAAAQLSLQ